MGETRKPSYAVELILIILLIVCFKFLPNCAIKFKVFAVGYCRSHGKYDGRLCLYRCLLTRGTTLISDLSPERTWVPSGQDKGLSPQPGQGYPLWPGQPPHLDRRVSAITPQAVSLLQSHRRTFLLDSFTCYSEDLPA